jgi:hypothetical protein
MEPRVKIISTNPGFSANILDYYDACRDMCEESYSVSLSHYRLLQFDNVTPSDFWKEYLWCCSVSGFNSKILAVKFTSLLKAYGEHPWLTGLAKWEDVEIVLANKAKFAACNRTIGLMLEYWKCGVGWWKCFKNDYLKDVEAIGKLPFMGPTMRYHLARNIGLDTVKPDLHLWRLAKHYKFDSPIKMCEYIQSRRTERLGVIDLILFYGASEWGSLEIKEEGAR